VLVQSTCDTFRVISAHRLSLASIAAPERPGSMPVSQVACLSHPRWRIVR
jgi:hypothetical protein